MYRVLNLLQHATTLRPHTSGKATIHTYTCILEEWQANSNTNLLSLPWLYRWATQILGTALHLSHWRSGHTWFHFPRTQLEKKRKKAQVRKTESFSFKQQHRKQFNVLSKCCVPSRSQSKTKLEWPHHLVTDMNSQNDDCKTWLPTPQWQIWTEINWQGSHWKLKHAEQLQGK